MSSGWEDDVGIQEDSDHDQGASHMEEDVEASNTLPGFAVRIRGIPFQESEHTVHKWFQERGVHIRNGVLGIHFVYSDNRQWSGDAYAALETEKDLETALKHDQDQMNQRYLEIFPCSTAEMEDVLKRTGYFRLANDYTIRLRGLEFKVTREDIQTFFKGLEIASGLDGIFIIKNHDGRTTGEAYVLFENKAGVEAALQKHKEKMGDRYVEIFLASSAHLRDALAGDGGGSRGRDQGGYGRGAQKHQQDEHYGRGGHRQQTHFQQLDDPRLNQYQGFYPPNDRVHGGAQGDLRAPDQRPFRGGPSFAGYDHGMPAQSMSCQPGFRLYMRGLPWSCCQKDIEQFFGDVKPKEICKNMSESNVFDGSAWVEFASEEDMTAGKALHKTNMGHRYIELFTEKEVEEKRLGTKTGRVGFPRSERGMRSARGGREGAGPRGGGGARHGGTRGGHSFDSVQSDYGRVGSVGPRTPYDRPLQFRGGPNSGFNPTGLHRGGYASYTSYHHQPVSVGHNQPSGASTYGGGGGGRHSSSGGGSSHSSNSGSGGGGGGYGYTLYPQFSSMFDGGVAPSQYVNIPSYPGPQGVAHFRRGSGGLSANVQYPGYHPQSKHPRL